MSELDVPDSPQVEEDDFEDEEEMSEDNFINEEEEEENDSDEESDDHNDVTQAKLEQLEYHFDVDCALIPPENNVYAVGNFRTNVHEFNIGFYTYDEKSKAVYPFIYVADSKEHIGCQIKITVNGTTVEFNNCSFDPGDDLIRAKTQVFDEVPNEPFLAEIDFKYIPNENECRRFYGCVGLINDGMTCYLNSLIQALYHIRGFRRIVFDLPFDKSEIPMALATVFSRMQRRSKPVSTKRLTRSFGWEASDLFEQQDAQELLHILFDRIDNVSQDAASKLFKGKMKRFIRGLTEKFENSHLEDYMDISLCVSGIGSLNEALEKFFETDKLVGPNQYQLEDGKKVDAEMGTEIAETPQILCLHLRRFEYKDGGMCKVTSRFEFGEDLVFNNNDYTLVSIISHVGTVFGGHYNAFVHKDGLWLRFDDETVMDITPEEAIEGNFGGQKHDFTAYVLFYVRNDKFDELVACPDPEINMKVIEDEERRRRNRTITIITPEDLEPTKVDVPRKGGVLSMKAALAEVTSLNPDEITVRFVDKAGEVKDEIDDTLASTAQLFFVSSMKNPPVFTQVWTQGNLPMASGVFEATDDATAESIFEQIRKEYNIEQETARCYLELSDTAADEFSGELGGQSMHLTFQLEKAIEGMEAFQPPEDSLAGILDLEMEDFSTFKQLTNCQQRITVKYFGQNKKMNFKVQIPKEATFAMLVDLVAKKCEQPSDHIILFRGDSMDYDFRPITSSPNSSVAHLFSNSTTIYYDIAPEQTSLVDRVDVTVLDEDGSPAGSRTRVFLNHGAETPEDLLKALQDVFDFEFGYFYISDGIPMMPRFDDHVELHRRVVVQKGLREPNDDEVKIRVVHICQGIPKPDASIGIPFFYIAKRESTVSEILAGFDLPSEMKAVAMCGTSKNLIHAEETVTTPELADGFIAITHPFETVFNMYESNAPLRMNK